MALKSEQQIRQIKAIIMIANEYDGQWSSDPQYPLRGAYNGLMTGVYIGLLIADRHPEVVGQLIQGLEDAPRLMGATMSDRMKSQHRRAADDIVNAGGEPGFPPHSVWLHPTVERYR